MLLDILAIVLGILYSVRKLEVRRREPEDFPHVPTDEFLRWRNREVGAYSLTSLACFAKLLLDYAFLFYAQRAQLDPRVVRAVGASLFGIWVLLLVVSFIRANSARKLREQLGIDLAANRAKTS
jgi:hypothetical protein